ncbi:hypothetical protein VTH8203_01652 [Vibrio thalassae]|uniref:YHS domain protein n=1 Tax=Vibrio thalassae TaxID=1243014 RepID=A0A240EHL2_9VIBR|nr:hypothetical protein VTH8203_01652 [Vibrio thalassae]
MKAFSPFSVLYLAGLRKIYEIRNTIYFNSTTLVKFVANPTAYAPQYGGYCAWAVSQVYTASIDPNAWYILENKLYLNYSKSVQQRCQQDISRNIQKADLHWPELLQN